MSIKSICLSILSFVLFAGVIVAEIFLFKVHFIAGIVGIAIISLPLLVHKKALNEANGAVDKFIAKIAVPVLALIAIVFIVLTFTLWI